jgi:hypothetical protein
MPISSITEARDDIIGLFTTAWNAQTPPIPLLIYQDKESDLPDNAPFARLSIEHTIFNQQTLANVGNRRFRRFGIITVQIFSLAGEGLANADVFAKVALDAFEGKATGADSIEFRNVRINEIGIDGPWFQTNVLAEFEYDEIK